MTKKERIAYWRKLVGKQAESGLSARAFCIEHHINPSRFYHWRIRFRNEQSKDPSSGFVELIPLKKTQRAPFDFSSMMV